MCSQNRAPTIGASGLVNGAINARIVHLLPPAAQLLWNAGTPLLEADPYSLQVRMGYVLKLDAMTADPDALVKIVRDLRDHLVACSPDLDVMQRPV